MSSEPFSLHGRERMATENWEADRHSMYAGSHDPLSRSSLREQALRLFVDRNVPIGPRTGCAIALRGHAFRATLAVGRHVGSGHANRQPGQRAELWR